MCLGKKDFFRATHLERHLVNIFLNLGISEFPSDQTVCCEEGVFRVDDCLTLGGDTDKTLTLLGETNDGGGSSGT